MAYSSGEEFLNTLYSDLHLSDVVMHTALKSDKPSQKIARYLNRLIEINKLATSEHKRKILYGLYHAKYVIKMDNLPPYLRNGEKYEIIKTQRESLDKWLDYLTDENTMYPMWAKYWAFQGMLKIGTYNEEKDIYTRRNSKTQAPFLEVNPALISKCIHYITQHINGGVIEDEDLKKLVSSGSFQKLYVHFKKEYTNYLNLESGYEGEWIKYNYGDVEDAKKLYESLQGFSNPWCTAGSVDTAINQVCSGGGYNGGDFYVYYTPEKGTDRKIPRIAIRMNGTNRIGEIRGVGDNSQNIEDGFEEIIKNKLDSMEFLSKEERESQNTTIKHLRLLTKLNQKIGSNKPLTPDEIMFMYEINEDINGFGWDEDPRIAKIRSKLIISDRGTAIKLFQNRHDVSKNLSSNLRKDEEIMKIAVKINSSNFQYASKELRGKRSFALLAAKRGGFIFEHLPEEMRDDKELLLESFEYHSYNLKFASDRLKKDPEVIKAALKNGSYVLEFVDEGFRENKKIMKIALEHDVRAIQYCPDEIKNNKEIARIILSKNGKLLYCLSDKIRHDKKLIKIALQNEGTAMMYVPNEFKNDTELATIAVSQNGQAMEFCSDEIKNNKEIAQIAMNQSIIAFRYLSETLRNDPELALQTVHMAGIFEFVSPQLKQNSEFMKEVIKQEPGCLSFASDDIKDDPEIISAAASDEPYSFRFASDRLKNNREFVIQLIKNNYEVFEFLPISMKKEYEIILLVMKQSDEAFRLILKELINDKELLKEIIKIHPYTYRNFPDEVFDDPSFVLEILPYAYSVIEKVSSQLTDDKEFMKGAIKIDGSYLEYASEELRKDRELVFESVRKMIADACEEFDGETEELIEEAKKYYSSVEYLSDEIKSELLPELEDMVRKIIVK